MKLAELKNRFKNKYMIRIVAGVLTVAVVSSSATVYNVYAAKSTKTETVESTETKIDTKDTKDTTKKTDTTAKDNSDDAEDTVGKDETVYVITDAAGNAKSTIVSEWLKNLDGTDTLEDVSDLKDIKNVKGDETFTQSGDSVKWKADGNDIYYQGTTTKESPVTTKITYYLDGKKIEPDKLAGQSGKVKIRIDYTNNEKDGDVYVPFMVISGMVLNEDFTNIKVTNGKVISNGNNNMVVGTALPGLKESLQVTDSDFTDDVTIPEYVEMTADVKDFKLSTIMSVVSGCSDLMSDKTVDTSEIDDKVDDVTDAMDQLKDGSGDLSDGLGTLSDSVGEFSTGMDSLQSGISAYTAGAKTLADGIGTLKSQSTTLVNGVSQLTSSVSTLNSGVKLLDKSLNTAMSSDEKNAAMQTAKAAAEKAVEAQFADTNNAQSYQNIKATAGEQFAGTLTSDANIAAVKDQAAATVQAQAGQISEQAKAQAAAQLSQNAAVQSQLSQIASAAQAAGQMQYAQSEAGQAAIQAKVQAMIAQYTAAGFTAEQISAMQSVLVGAATADVMQNDGGAQAAGAAAAANVSAGLQQAITESAGQVAVATATQVAPQTAESTVRGVAAQAKDSVGTSVAESVKTAAKTAAGTAAGQAAVEGAESAKKQIAASIEKKDKKTGYSLVSGMSALDTAVNGMSGKMPELTSGIDKLYTGSQTLASKNDELNSGAAKLTDGKNQLVDGIGKLKDGSEELADGIVKFDEEGIEKLVNSYTGDIKPFVDRLQKVVDAGKGYDSFAGKSDKVTGDVKFIIKSEEIK